MYNVAIHSHVFMNEHVYVFIDTCLHKRTKSKHSQRNGGRHTQRQDAQVYAHMTDAFITFTSAFRSAHTLNTPVDLQSEVPPR